MAARPLVICLMGPTASGKTDLAIALAERRDCELVSVDSALVYRGLDIGSAKPDYPHHLVDIRDPADPYSVAEFCDDARAAILDILSRGRTPLLVGGTMLYFKALLEGIADMPAADPEVRKHLESEAAAKGWPHLHRMLEEVDPELAATIHPNHSQRIGRALEVYLSSGVTMSEWRRRQAARGAGVLEDAYSVLQLAICPAERSELHARIARRVDQMIEAGLVEEVRALYQRGDLTLDLPSMRAVGYRQMWGHVRGEYDLARARELVIQATRQLAKRQLTWLRGWPRLHWIQTDANGMLETDPRQGPLDAALKYVQSATIDTP
ncbi:MAG: tRNA (adenosine(37)-N6)-dimethylallyltransferase MiaA [Halieaceae bacterium]|jgi:tRNA dimethylallyltransferase|nr:tRNA (adenosine(37)-N6)-dimethylallyltransferase MiaA [Halieaceae bacterium]